MSEEQLELFPEPSSSESPPPHTENPGVVTSALGGDRSLLASATKLLSSAWRDKEGALDLADTLVLVPTRHAGRRLREALAICASERDAAVFPPLVTTQDFLVSPDRIPDAAPVADRQLTSLIWSALLLDLDLHRFRRVFPVDPVERNLGWAMNTARELLEVRNLLAEAALTFASASDTLADHGMEPARWKELATLEEQALALTDTLGFRDDSRSRIEASEKGILPPEIRRILVLGTPDLRPISIRALQHLSSSIPVEIHVYTAGSDLEDFDRWGRPLPAKWLEKEIAISNPHQSIHRAATPSDQARLAFSLLDGIENPAALVAIGVPDPEVIAPLRQIAANYDWTTYDPAGTPVSRHGIYYLLEQTERLVESESYDAACRLFCCPDFTRACISSLALPEDRKFGPASLLRLLDDLTTTAMPYRIPDAIASARRTFHRSPELRSALEWVADWIARFRTGDFGRALTDYLSEVFATRRFQVTECAHGAFQEVSEAILQTEEAFRTAEPVFGKNLSPAEHFQLLLELIRERRLYDERKTRDIDLQGWLELLWEDAPHLIVTGMNDDFVPEAVVGHAFLPDSARRTLGIFHNDDRFARDAYLLSATIASRAGTGGRLDLIFGRESESNDPLRPSRLLFQCPDEELPARTLQLFGDSENGERPVARSVAFPLRPRPLDPDHRVFHRLSVSALKQYLTCPFRFYLKQGLGMEAVETNKREMDAADFGNLIHETLDRFGGDPSVNQSSDAGEISAYFHQTLDTILEENFGGRLSTPVVIQREAARKRLGWWSEVEAEQRKAGWSIAGCEESFGVEDWPFEFDGTTLRGRVDRIEKHPEYGFRVLDFKTISPFVSNKLKTVSEYHLVPLKTREDPDDFPEWSLCENGAGKVCRWADLQVPLYVLAMQERNPGDAVSAGYGTLGKTEAEVRVDTWDTLDETLLTAARSCARGIIESVRNEIFWPPQDDPPPWDEFLDHLAPDPESAVDFTLLHR